MLNEINVNVIFFYRKARKRDRECMGSDNERKLYLQDPLLELRIPETEINFLTDLPENDIFCLIFTAYLNFKNYFRLFLPKW